MQTHYLWWPVSPIGFIIASSEITSRHIWHNYFLGWLISVLIRHYGGLRLYAKLRPVFLGMIIGQIVTWFILYIGGRLIGLQPPGL